MLALMLAAALAQGAPAPTPPPAFAGAWVVDLTPSKDAKPYLKGMVLEPVADGSVTGSFYDSTIEAGRSKTFNGRTCVSFRTTDGKGPYHTAACLVGDAMQGQTWAEQRKFVFIWNARRATAEDRKQPWW